MSSKEDEALRQIIEHGIDRIDEFKGQNIEAADLHHHLYNEDYFIIGTWKAEKFLDKVGAFNAIGVVQEYEQSNFGEITTDLSDPEKVANMYAYIVGELTLSNCSHLSDKWNEKLTDEDLSIIKSQLEVQLKATR